MSRACPLAAAIAVAVVLAGCPFGDRQARGATLVPSG